MVRPEFGTKRTCPSCSARFYDLNKNPITCPKCGHGFVDRALLPSQADEEPDMAAGTDVGATGGADHDGEPEIDLVSLEDVDKETADGSDDGEENAVSDVGDAVIADGDDAIKGNDDTLLEDEVNGEASHVSGGGL
ncbi:MAG: TIGR02300 family protein [Hyphomicrobiales bacterium]